MRRRLQQQREKQPVKGKQPAAKPAGSPAKAPEAEKPVESPKKAAEPETTTVKGTKGVVAKGTQKSQSVVPEPDQPAKAPAQAKPVPQKGGAKATPTTAKGGIPPTGKAAAPAGKATKGPAPSAAAPVREPTPVVPSEKSEPEPEIPVPETSKKRKQRQELNKADRESQKIEDRLKRKKTLKEIYNRAAKYQSEYKKRNSTSFASVVLPKTMVPSLFHPSPRLLWSSVYAVLWESVQRSKRFCVYSV